MAAHQQQPHNSTFLLDALYCSEENWEDELRVDCFQVQDGGLIEEEEEEEGESFYFINKTKTIPVPVPMLHEQDLSWQHDELSTLLSKEVPNRLYNILKTNPSLSRARSEAVDWMLKVNAHYSFTALTALLAVNYLDRFLFSFQLQRDKPWMAQLAAVACLSLAAKVEETQVPLLLDLQVEDTKFVFEAKTIQRMEILVLSTLQWKMNPVTPLSFLDYIARRLGLKGYLCWEFLKRCDRILLSAISDSSFMQYLPSVMANATMLHVVQNIEPSLGVEYEKQLLNILGTDKDKVEHCSKLIMQLAEQVRGQGSQSNKRKFGSITVPVVPGSPNGVMDVSFSSSDSSNDSWSVASSVSSSPEPLSKKNRSHAQDHDQDQLLLQGATPDFLTIPRYL
ncbi:hypothetical protein CICLE_v10001416mg [Citrus x clementina]|uniref:Uncharacterized protein n=1 Tax=Citrus clementina TaxID=85681 RepID=V4T428_CITCL|nr:cyclin-D3-1 [Citrus x clementina]ESR47942.1 hypothetical protein CICLE_v10001416mg [Citrus x clementina]